MVFQIVNKKSSNSCKIGLSDLHLSNTSPHEDLHNRFLSTKNLTLMEIVNKTKNLDEPIKIAKFKIQQNIKAESQRKETPEYAVALIASDPKGTPALSWKSHNFKEYLRGFKVPQFVKEHNNIHLTNWLMSAVSFFVAGYVKENVCLTWIDLPVPDQFIDLIGCKSIMIDQHGPNGNGTIFIYKKIEN